MRQEAVDVGLIGGGLMGKELAAAISRWPALQEHPVRPRLAAVCDKDPDVLAWFDRIDTVRLKTRDHAELLGDENIQVVYVAVPHNLHESIYLDVIEAGKDLMGEKPFGIDLAAARRIVEAIEAKPQLFVRCSSEIPYFPGAQYALAVVRSGAVGRIIEAENSFLHSSDLDRSKPINWKRRRKFCGDLGVMGDLGLHALHVPLRLGWMPSHVFATLQDIVTERPGANGAPVPCDTIDNATLTCEVTGTEGSFPLTVATKRIAPGEMNTWRLRVLGMEGGVEFSTARPKNVMVFTVEDGRQAWQRIETGSSSIFPTITGSIFEFGFPDALLQMWAAFFAERAGALGDRFGCVTPREALQHHEILAAALLSGESRRAESVARRHEEPVRETL